LEIFLIYAALGAALAVLGCLVSFSKYRSAYIASAVVAGLLIGLAGWSFVPAVNGWFSMCWYLCFFAFAIGCAFGCIRSDYEAPNITGFGALVSVIIGFWIVGFMTTDPLFRWEGYRDLMGPVKEAQTFDKDVAPIDTKKLRVVNGVYAVRIADKLLGEQQGLGSQVDLGRMHISQMNGCFEATTLGALAPQKVCFEHELVWVAPLVHSGFFRWFTNHATHGYVLVSASDPERKLLVTAVNGNPVDLRYMAEGAHWNDYLIRHLRGHGYAGFGLTEPTFELDDAGKPWWVVTTYQKRVGFSGDDATGVVVVDPSTGATNWYNMKNVPAWVDRVVPEGMAIEQFDNQGRFVGGWMNSWTSKFGMYQTSTDFLHLVEGVNGRTYWYTGITSVGNDQSTTGFILIDTKTKEVRRYKIPGAIEDASRSSVENYPEVKKARYGAGEAILYNMGGVPTYFMTLSGNDSIPRMYAFASVRDYQIVAASESIDDALRLYQDALQEKPGAAFEQKTVTTATAEGVIVRIAENPDGKSRWMLLTVGKASQEYSILSALSPEVKYAEAKDRVRLEYEPGAGKLLPRVKKFDDLELELTK